MKQLIILLVALFALAACSKEETAQPVAEETAVADPAEQAEATADEAVEEAVEETLEVVEESAAVEEESADELGDRVRVIVRFGSSLAIG